MAPVCEFIIYEDMYTACSLTITWKSRDLQVVGCHSFSDVRQSLGIRRAVGLD